MRSIVLRASRDLALSPLAGESWSGGYGSTTDQMFDDKLLDDLRFARRASRATPLPTLPHKGGGIWGALS